MVSAVRDYREFLKSLKRENKFGKFFKGG